jgi:ATP-binding cassette, subfamily B, multidrug efflux pump
MEVIIPTVMAYLIDYGIGKKNLPLVLWIGLALVGCSAVSLISGVLAGRSASIASAGFARNLRHDVYCTDYGFQN